MSCELLTEATGVFSFPFSFSYFLLINISFLSLSSSLIKAVKVSEMDVKGNLACDEDIYSSRSGIFQELEALELETQERRQISLLLDKNRAKREFFLTKEKITKIDDLNFVMSRKLHDKKARTGGFKRKLTQLRAELAEALVASSLERSKRQAIASWALEERTSFQDEAKEARKEKSSLEQEKDERIVKFEELLSDLGEQVSQSSRTMDRNVKMVGRVLQLSSLTSQALKRVERSRGPSFLGQRQHNRLKEAIKEQDTREPSFVLCVCAKLFVPFSNRHRGKAKADL